MTLHFAQELEQLKDKLLRMAGLAEQAVARAMHSLESRDADLALRVKEHDDALDHLEMEIDTDAVNLLAQAPLASDLRLITVMMKISRDLERIGDEATSIARRARELTRELPLSIPPELLELWHLTGTMLHDALNAFVRRDAAAARAVGPRDRDADALNKAVRRLLIEVMSTQREAVSRALNLVTISKSLERIGDHATNIAEDVVYLCEALDIRHQAKGVNP